MAGQQAAAAQQAAAQQADMQQVTNAQAPSAQAPVSQASPAQAPQTAAPTAVAAWHGSPAPDDNGHWYYQPGPGPQQNGATAGGYAVNGMAANGYAQPDQGTGPAAQLNGLAGMQQSAVQQYGQPAQPAPVTGYQQAPWPPSAMVGQQPQPGQPGQLSQPTQVAQPGQVTQPHQAVHQVQTVQAPPLTPPVAQQAPAPPSAASTMLAPPVTAPPAPPAPLATAQRAMTQPLPAPPTTVAGPTTAPSQASATGPIAAPPPTSQADQAGAHSGLTAVGALSKLTGVVRGRRAARKPRLAMSAIFADLVDMADIPRSAYAVDEEITGAMCLFKTDGGYEVFSCAEDARHEVRFFEEEEAAYFYLFGVLTAEALRSGRLSPRRG
jgi:hypothetical protein